MANNVSNQYRSNYSNLQPGSLGESGFAFNTMHNYTDEQLVQQNAPSMGAGVGGGVMKGAGMGTTIMGPGWGTLIGAVAGGLYGGITAGADRKRIGAENQVAERRMLAMQTEQQQMANNQATLAINQQFPTQGSDVQGFYGLGGTPMGQHDFVGEGGEVVLDNPNNPAQAVSQGGANRLASNAVKIQGPSHESQAGGVQMSGGERVFSKRLKVGDADLKKLMIR